MHSILGRRNGRPAGGVLGVLAIFVLSRGLKYAERQKQVIQSGSNRHRTYKNPQIGTKTFMRLTQNKEQSAWINNKIVP